MGQRPRFLTKLKENLRRLLVALPSCQWRQKVRTRQENEMLMAMGDIDGWLSDEVALLLYRLAQSSCHLGPVVEIGSWQGKSTVVLGLALLDRIKISHLWTKPGVIAIDPHTGSQEHNSNGTCSVNTLPLFLANLQRWGVDAWTHPLVMTSMDARSRISGTLSGVFIDGSHEYEDVHNDFQAWFSRLEPGGWMAFHDSKWPGVKKVLWEEFYTNPLVGCIQRIEDTTFAFKLSCPHRTPRLWNVLALKYYQRQQERKRQRRKLRRRQQAACPSCPKPR